MSESRSFLGRLFGFIWGVFVVLFRTFVVLGVLLSLALAWFAFKGKAPVAIDDNVALILAPSGSLVEQIDADPGQQFLEDVSGDMPSQSSLRDLIDALNAARDDDRIPFAVLKLDGLWGAGLAQLDELRAAMSAFQASGKRIVAYSAWYDQTQYYAAAQADEVVLDPYGAVNVEGFSSYTNYFKDALDKLGVNIHVFRVGEYKSAVEPFTRNDMSSEARAANLEWLGDLWSSYGEAVSAGRKLDAGAVNAYINGMVDGLKANGGDSAIYARDKGLVTQLETLSEFRTRMAQTVGLDEEHGSFRQIHYQDYLATRNRELSLEQAAEKGGVVALVVIQGEIVDGPGEPGQAGGETIYDLLDEARRDPEVRAVVLRIDSPGGSVWASEQIRRAVNSLRAEGKPVVASMSSVAASGGYWVAMDADQIWAHPTTITGSIGVFGLIPTLEGSLQKIGVHTDGVGTTAMAGAFRIDRPLSPEIEVIIQAGIDKVYKDFVGGVAAGRKLPVEKVDTLARGRVWSGTDAREMGLVDEFGGLEDAAAAAAKLAGLNPETYQLDERQPDRGFAAALLSSFSGKIEISAIGALIPGAHSWLQQLQSQADVQQLLTSFNDPRGAYARCFCTVTTGRTH